VSHFAGLSGVRGYVDGTLADARFYNPFAIVIDSTKAVLYLADQNNLIRAISNLHGEVTVSTIAGLPQAGSIIDGVGTASRFNLVYALAIDATAQVLYASDYNNHAIRRINLKTNLVDTIAGGRFGFPSDAVGTNIFFAQPTGLALLGGKLYIGEWRNGVIRQLDLTTMAATVFAGDGDFSSGVVEGTGVAAKVPMVSGLTVDVAAKVLYASLNFDATVVRITADGTVSIVSGSSPAADGVGLNARFGHISGMAVAADDSLLVVDSKANAIRRVVTSSGAVTTVAGSLSAPAGFVNGPATAARFNRPLGLTVSGSTVYVSDANNFAIRALFLANGTVATFAGGRGAGLADGAALSVASLTMPAALVAYKSDLYFLDCVNSAFRFGTTVAIRQGDKFRRVRAGVVTTIGQTAGTDYFNFNGALSGMALDPSSPDGAIYFSDFWNAHVHRYTEASGFSLVASSSWPAGLAFDPVGKSFLNSFVLGQWGTWALLRFSVQGTSVTGLGNAVGAFGPGSLDGLFGNTSAFAGGAALQPTSLAFDSKGGFFVAHGQHNKIVRVGRLAGQACSFAQPPQSPLHVCHPGTYIDWASETCRPCSAAASTDVFPFSSYCQDANGLVIQAPSVGSVAAVAGVSVGAIVGGVVVIVALLAVRAYYVVNAPPPPKKSSALKRRPSRGEGGGTPRAVEGVFASPSPVGQHVGGRGPAR